MHRRILLDSHVVVWLLDQAPIGANARRAIMQSEQLYCSAASIWELTIKAASGRLELPELFVPTIAQSGVRFLDVTVDHARAITNVSLLHKDPFDRLLLAQVLAENLAFMTADTAILSTNQPFLIDARQ